MDDRLDKAVDNMIEFARRQHETMKRATEKLRKNTKNEHNPYLFNSMEAFLASLSFQGSHKIKKYHHFDQWLYIGAYRGFSKRDIIDGDFEMKLKIGFSSNLRQREAQLNSDTHYKLKIVYSWPIPNAQLFETQALRYFKHFIHKDAFSNERTIETTEVIWSLDLLTVVRIIRLLILKYAVLNDFIQCDQDLKIFYKNFMVDSPTGIRSRNKPRFANFRYKDVTEDVDSLYSQVGGPEDNEFYSHVLSNWRRIPEDSKINGTAYDEDAPNELNLKYGDLTYALFNTKTYPIRIEGFGLGPYKGAVYVQWLKFENVRDPRGYIDEADKYDPEFIDPDYIQLNLPKSKTSGGTFKLRL